MGRQFKKVPLDFSWPLQERWKGYVNPHYHKCKDCQGYGETSGAMLLQSILRLLVLGATESLTPQEVRDNPNRIWPHPYLLKIPNLRSFYETKPSKDLGDLITRLNGIDIYSDGKYWSIQKMLIEAAGLDPYKWGKCITCDGEGLDPKFKKDFDSWSPYDPPEGEGFQLWENTSEGAPISPVFQTIEDLCEYAATHCTIFASEKLTKEKWMNIFKMKYPSHKIGNLVFV